MEKNVIKNLKEIKKESRRNFKNFVLKEKATNYVTVIKQKIRVKIRCHFYFL